MSHPGWEDVGDSSPVLDDEGDGLVQETDNAPNMETVPEPVADTADGRVRQSEDGRCRLSFRKV